MDERQRRVLESIENLILHPNTSEHERNAGINRWEHITGEKWTGKPKTRSSSSSGAGSQNSGRKSSNSDPFDEFWKRYGGFSNSGFGGFGGFGFDDSGTSGFYDDVRRERERREQQQRQQQQQQRQQQSKTNWSYDFGGGCTEKQYNYIRSICEFFRWKCPQRHEIEFDEASEFLNKYSELFQLFNARTRNFASLKKLFEALGIDWDQTRRTWKWKAYNEK